MRKMTTFLKVLATWILLAVNFCHCTTTLSPDVDKNSTHSDTYNAQYMFSPHFRKIIVGMYKQNFDNFNKVLNFAEVSNDNIFMADVILELYHAMSEAKHTENPIKALYLYNEIESIINFSGENLTPVKLNELQIIRQKLVSETIVPKGVKILEVAIYMNEFIQRELIVGKFMKLLHLNETLSSLTIKLVVETVHWMPFEELLPILTNFSFYVEQNVDALLSLYEERSLQETEQFELFISLLPLTRKFDNDKSLSEEKLRRINAIIPKALQVLLNKTVCFYQEIGIGEKASLYAFAMDSTIYRSYDLRLEAAFRVEIKHKPLAFNFYHSLLQWPLSIEPREHSESSVHLSENPTDDIDWKVQFEGEKVVLQNMNSTKFLCTDGSRVYTRNHESFLLHAEECKWIAADYNRL